MDLSASAVAGSGRVLREWWLGYLARGAQQQAAQREKRQGEDTSENGLLHAGDYS